MAQVVPVGVHGIVLDDQKTLIGVGVGVVTPELHLEAKRLAAVLAKAVADQATFARPRRVLGEALVLAPSLACVDSPVFGDEDELVDHRCIRGLRAGPLGRSGRRSCVTTR